VLLTLWATYALSPRTSCKIYTKILTAILGLVVVLLSTFGHMYNGDASIDSVMLGGLLAVWTVSTFHNLLREPIMAHIKELQKGKTQNPNLRLTRNIVLLFTTLGVMLLLGISFYFIAVETVDNEAVWETNIRAKCPDYFETSNNKITRFYADFIFSSFGSIGCMTGAYLGITL
jgi:hypothetical protein